MKEYIFTIETWVTENGKPLKVGVNEVIRQCHEETDYLPVILSDRVKEMIGFKKADDTFVLTKWYDRKLVNVVLFDGKVSITAIDKRSNDIIGTCTYHNIIFLSQLQEMFHAASNEVLDVDLSSWDGSHGALASCC